MRLQDLFEAPIGNWTVDPDFDANEREMISKFTGYDREQKHWSDADKTAIRDESTITRVRSAFMKTPHVFDIYFWQSTNPDYDPTLEKGQRDIQWIERVLGPKVAQAVQPRPGVITIVMTNNLSDERKISMKSPWMVGHRIAHAIIGDGIKSPAGFETIFAFDKLVENICRIAYEVDWPKRRETNLDSMLHNEYLEVYTPIIGHMLGTMKSARNGHLIRPAEWQHETFTQYLLTGRVTFRSLSERLDSYYTLTDDPKRRIQAEKLLRKFTKNITKKFDAVLEEAEGKIWVM